ncbi:hypothetical protein HU147_10060 [Planomicrobium chinense]|uniref:hypothetical protein n=1 Tax=Planococcus chinensis TaxID=272917 RepID=UPI001CC4D9D8|nr:hypothetical protein [Planococcus chinensis]MBZ5201559.1 hypothetical protein [Planococcus chinensis]
MWQKQKNTFVTGFLLILLPLLFIFTGGVPTLSRLIGLGEGFPYTMAAVLLFIIFIGLLFLIVGVAKTVFQRII